MPRLRGRNRKFDGNGYYPRLDQVSSEERLEIYKALNERKKRVTKCKRCLYNDGGFCRLVSKWCPIVNTDCNKQVLKV